MASDDDDEVHHANFIHASTQSRTEQRDTHTHSFVFGLIFQNGCATL